MVLEAKEIIWCSVEGAGGKRESWWLEYLPVNAQFYGEKAERSRGHVLVGIQDQGNVVKAAACCGLVVWQGGKTDGPQTENCFPLGFDDRMQRR